MAPYVVTRPAGMHLHTAYSRDSKAVGGRLGLPLPVPMVLEVGAARAAGRRVAFGLSTSSPAALTVENIAEARGLVRVRAILLLHRL